MANENVASNSGAPDISRWWRVVGGVSMNLALGSLYAWSVFVAPLEKEFKWKRAETSMVFTIAVVVFALTFIVAGRLQDKLGPFKISLAGAVLVSLGFFFCSYADSLSKFFIFFGVLGGLGNGFGYATPIPVMSKWFPDKRGLAVGLAVGGYGGGSAIFGPLAASYLIPHFGWRATFQVLGVIFFAMTVFGAFLLKNPPAGYKPAGWTPAPASKVAATTYDFTPGEVLRTPSFYLLWVGYALWLRGRSHGHQPAGALRQERGHTQHHFGFLWLGGGRDRKRHGPYLVGLDVGPPGPRSMSYV